MPTNVSEVNPINHSPAWHLARRAGIGGSDWSHLLGEDEYGCKRRLYYSKSGKEEDFPEAGNFRLRRGTRQEPVAREYYAEQTGRRVEHGFGAFVLRDENGPLPFRANIDGIVFDSGRGQWGVLEIKTLGIDSFNKYKKAGLPPHYIAQAQWGAGILELPFTSYAIFNAELDDLAHFDIEADGAFFNNLKQMALYFWEKYVLRGTPPDRLDPDSKACKYCPFRLSCQGLSKSGVNKLKF